MGASGKGSKLQIMTVKSFSENKLLCPLTTLIAYMDRTKFVHQSVDHLFVLVTTSVPRRASQATIVRWCKDMLRDAGLGTYSLHSTRGASATSALLMALPLDKIVARVGRVNANTFIKYYMKPVENAAAKNIVKQPPKLSDPHNFTDAISNISPRTKIVGSPNSLKMSSQKKEKSYAQNDNSFVSDNDDEPTLVTVCTEDDEFHALEQDSDPERFMIDKLTHSINVHEENVMKMHVFRETLSSFFPTHDLKIQSPAPSTSLCSPLSVQIPSPNPSEFSQISTMTGNLSLGEHCIPPVKSLSTIPVHVPQYYNPRAVMALQSPREIKEKVLPPHTLGQSLSTTKSTTMSKDHVNKELTSPIPLNTPMATVTSPVSNENGTTLGPQQVVQEIYGRKKADPQNKVWTWINCFTSENPKTKFNPKAGINWNFIDKSKALVKASHHDMGPLQLESGRKVCRRVENKNCTVTKGEMSETESD